MQTKAKDVAELLKVLSNANRLLIFCALMENPLTVQELQLFVPTITQGALSQHLLLLKQHHILDSKKEGQFVTYFISDHRVEKLIGVLKDYFC